MAQRYSTATLADIYSVIAYYLRHRDEIEAYLDARAQRAKEVANALSAPRGTYQTCGSACAHANRGTDSPTAMVDFLLELTIVSSFRAHCPNDTEGK